MNVLMLNTEIRRGGAARIAVTLSNTINNECKGIKTKIIHFGNRTKQDNFIGIRKPWVFYLIALQTRIFGSYRVYDFGVSNEILNYTKRQDIIHLHNLHGYYINYTYLLEYLGKKPIIWTWHDMWGATGRCGFSEACDRWKNFCAPCPHKELYPKAWLDNSAQEYKLKFEIFSAMPCLHVVCPSQWLADIAIMRGFDASKISVIPNPVDTDVFNKCDRFQARSKLGIKKNGPIALFIAYNCDDHRKGYRDFCSATRDGAYLPIAIGLKPTNPASHVRHIGRIEDRRKLSLYYAAADVMVIPSYADNYPNTVIESLVNGTPVIGYDEGGIPSQLADPFSQVVPKGKVDKLRDALDAFLNTIDESRLYSSKLASQSASRWSKLSVSQRYCRLYREVLHNA
jgi:glycosyltransferase involved in cell wall biosynthesis